MFKGQGGVISLRLFFSISVLLLSFTVSHGQNVYFPYYTSDTAVAHNLAEECCKRVSSSFVVPENVSKDYKKSYLESQKESVEYTRTLVRHTSLNDSLLRPFLNKVFQNIVKGNPSLSGYTIVLSDWPIMNAAYIGGSNIIVYVPLLSRLENESQVAAVLCHELAHGQLNHLQAGLKKRLDDYYSKEFQQQLKATLNEEFNLYSKIDLLALKFTFGSRFHQRSQEQAADSLGFLYLLNTGYEASQMTGALEVLKHVDEPAYKDKIIYSLFYKCDNTAFDFASIKPYKKTSIFNVQATVDTLADSLRTHPDCDKRIAFIKNLILTHPAKPVSGPDAQSYSKIKWAAAMEMIQSYYWYEFYDYALYNTLSYLQEYPDDEYLKSSAVLNTTAIYQAMKNHELSDALSNYSESSVASFNDFLYLFNSIKLSDLKSFVDCLYNNEISTLKENEFTIASGFCYSKTMEDQKLSDWVNKYDTQFKDGRFKYLIKTETVKTKKKK